MIIRVFAIALILRVVWVWNKRYQNTLTLKPEQPVTQHVFPDAVEAWRTLATKYGNRFLVPPEIVLSVIEQESSGNPDAVGDSGLAKGLMQLHAGATQDMGGNFDEMLDPEKNIMIGTKYLSWCFNRTLTWRGALQAYNGGIGNFRRNTVSEMAVNYSNEVLERIA
jgi:soluble lytic murein transglycosylase-like protein